MEPADSINAQNALNHDISLQLRTIRENQQDIRTALLGNPALGHRGLVERVERVEVTVDRHDRKLLVWGSIIAAATVSVGLIKDVLLTRSN